METLNTSGDFLQDILEGFAGDEQQRLGCGDFYLLSFTELCDTGSNLFFQPAGARDHLLKPQSEWSALGHGSKNRLGISLLNCFQKLNAVCVANRGPAC